jgi:transposase
MVTTTSDAFPHWLAHAGISAERLTAPQAALLQAAFHFRQQVGTDYYSTRLLSHFLLHCGSGLAVAQISRLLEISRPTASRQQGLSSKAAIQQAHHRLDGRAHGKLLPRFAGPIVEFLCRHPEATRADLLDFIDQTFGVRVSRIALYKFLKKYGLDQVGAAAAAPGAAAQASVAPPDAPPLRTVRPTATTPAPPFCSDARSSRARS